MIHALFTAFKQHLSTLALKEIAYYPGNNLNSPSVAIEFTSIPLNVERLSGFIADVGLRFHLHYSNLDSPEHRAEGEHLIMLDALAAHLQGFKIPLNLVPGYEDAPDIMFINGTDVLSVSPGHQRERNIEHLITTRSKMRWNGHMTNRTSATPNLKVNEQAN